MDAASTCGKKFSAVGWLISMTVSTVSAHWHTSTDKVERALFLTTLFLLYYPYYIPVPTTVGINSESIQIKIPIPRVFLKVLFNFQLSKFCVGYPPSSESSSVRKFIWLPDTSPYLQTRSVTIARSARNRT
jgi:hypothetical protein